MENVSLSNAALAELLARAAPEQEPGSNRRKAMERAARAAAFRWSEEAAALVAEGRSLTELPSVGPWLAGVLGGWLAAPDPPEPPEVRAGFLTLAEVRSTL